jgi:PAS domain S-box-containing protein
MERNAIATSLASSQPTARDVRGQGSSEFAATTRHLDDFAERMRSGRGIALAAEHDSQSIVDSIPAFVVLMTSSCELEHINRPMREYFGATTEKLEDRAGSEAMQEGDLPRLVKTFDQAINTGNSYEMEHRCRRFDGVDRRFLARGVPLGDATGRIVRWCFVLTDVEDKKRALSRRRYLVNATPCAGIERYASTHRLPNSKSIRKETSKDEAKIIITMRCGIIMRCRPDRNFHLCLYPVLPPCVFSIKYNGFNDIRSRRQQPLSAWRLPLNRNDRGSVVLAVHPQET